MRLAAQPTRTTGFAEALVGVVGVRHRANCAHALAAHHAQLAGHQLYLRVAGVLANQLGILPGGTRNLATRTGLEFDVVHDCADRDGPKRHRIARLDVDLGAGHDAVANLQALRRQDVRKLAVLVLQQRDERGAVRVVFQTFHDRRHVGLAATEVNDAVRLLVSTAPEEAGDAAVIVAPAGVAFANGEALDRLALIQVAPIDQHRAAKARRDRFKVF